MSQKCNNRADVPERETGKPQGSSAPVADEGADPVEIRVGGQIAVKEHGMAQQTGSAAEKPVWKTGQKHMARGNGQDVDGIGGKSLLQAAVGSDHGGLPAAVYHHQAALCVTLPDVDLRQSQPLYLGADLRRCEAKIVDEEFAQLYAAETCIQRIIGTGGSAGEDAVPQSAAIEIRVGSHSRVGERGGSDLSGHGPGKAGDAGFYLRIYFL